jgi:hypothetical protein
MQENVAHYIRGCILCCTKNLINMKQGPYHPLPVSTQPWEIISMDFLGGLPINRKGNDCLFMVVERFNKMCIMFPCKNTINVGL